ncbi:ABC transporter ATP-binding protein [Halalkalibacter lacteus]|uniref:ABC transporter ATP-binding protein n=1 Tax=Halalkalibacter lacteus TaxID=3090663 RepID=UPI002FCAC9FD
MEIVKVTKIEKHFGENHVIKGVNFSIEEGEVFGLLGPNGAGKTTLISILSAQMSTFSGQITINNLDIEKNTSDIKKLIGVVPQEIALYQELSAYDNLKFFGALYGLKRKDLKEKVKWILKLVGLEDRAHEPIKNYSGGMKRRINIAAALLHDPLVVFMDEPTVGIDPQSRNKIYELITLLKKQKKTIIYTTHYMEEATSLCDTIAILDCGCIIEYGKTNELLKKLHGGILELHLESTALATSTKEIIEHHDCVISSMQNNDKLGIIVTDTQDALQIIMNSLNSNNIKVNSINTMPPTLETLFLHLTGKELRE